MFDQPASLWLDPKKNLPHTYKCLPIAIDCDANMIAFIPDAQTLLTIVQGTDLGKP